VVEAAVDVGFADLSIKRVADRLGVVPTALYHHVANRHDLYVAAGEHVVDGLELPRDATSPGGYLRELAHALRHLEQRHPGIGAFCSTADPAATATEEKISAAAADLTEMDVSSTDAAMLTAIAANIAFSFAATERAEGQRAASDQADELFDWVITNAVGALVSDRANAPWNRR